jgi:DHA1 family multidrug resistance protein-like MFS transporter
MDKPQKELSISPASQSSSVALNRLGLSAFLISLPFGILLFGLPLIARELGAGTAAISGLMATYALLIVVLQPLVGWGLDRIGRRYFLVAGLIGYAVSSLVFGLTASVNGLFLAQLAQGVGSGLFWLAALAVISDLAPEEGSGREFGRLEEMSFRGILVGALFGFALIGLFNRNILGFEITFQNVWQLLFILFTTAAVGAIFIALRWIPETLESKTTPRVAGNALPKEGQKKNPKKWRLPQQLMILLGIVFLTSSAAELISPIFIPHLFDNVSSNLRSIALAFLPAALAGAFLPSRLGGLSDRVGRRKPIVIALFISGLVVFIVPFLRTLWPLAILSFVEAAAFAAATPAEESLVIEISGDENEGSALGMYTASAGLGGVIGPLLGGLLYKLYGSSLVFGMSALLFVVGALLVFSFIKEPKLNATDLKKS